jgi:hypothetical protein
MIKLKSLSLLILLGCLALGATPVSAACPAEPSMADYTVYPVFQANVVEPNIFIILDNSSSMNGAAYDAAYDHNTRYYGYFEPYQKYTYSSGIWYRDTNGDWDGNFLNWVCMRRVDLVRKVLMGGLATARTGGGNQTNIGESPTGWDITRWYDWGASKDTWGVTPNQIGTMTVPYGTMWIFTPSG